MKKSLRILKKVCAGMMIGASIGFLVFTIVLSKTSTRHDLAVFGYRIFIVLSDSMKKTDFDAGDLILIKETKDPSLLKEGDIISYRAQGENGQETIITHKIRKTITDGEGTPRFITYGTTTDTDDEKPVSYSSIIGQYTGRIPGIGKVFHFLKTPRGFVFCILPAFLLPLVMQIMGSLRLWARYKKEQVEELHAQKQQIESERELVQALQAEIKQTVLESGRE